MLKLRFLLLTLLWALPIAGLVACEKEGAFERAGEKTDEALEEAGEELEEAGEEIDEAIEDIDDEKP
jgi:hypothetical protein